MNSSLEWRRNKVQELASQGYNQSEISRILLFMFKLCSQGHSQREIAQILQVSNGTVKRATARRV